MRVKCFYPAWANGSSNLLILFSHQLLCFFLSSPLSLLLFVRFTVSSSLSLSLSISLSILLSLYLSVFFSLCMPSSFSIVLFFLFSLRPHYHYLSPSPSVSLIPSIYSRVAYIYLRSRAKCLKFRTTTSKINTLGKPLMQQKYYFIHKM